MKEEDLKPYNFSQKSFKAHLEEELEDPVTLDIMKNPYLLKKEGHTCDKSTWDIPKLTINPHTGIKFNRRELVKNRKVKAICKLFDETGNNTDMADEDLCIEIIKIIEIGIYDGPIDITIKKIFELISNFGKFLTTKKEEQLQNDLKVEQVTEEKYCSQSTYNHLISVIHNLPKKAFLNELMCKLYPPLEDIVKIPKRRQRSMLRPNKYEGAIEFLYKWLKTKYPTDKQAANEDEYHLIDQDTFDTIYGLLKNISTDMHKRTSEDKNSEYDVFKTIFLYPLIAFGLFQPINVPENSHFGSLVDQFNLSTIEVKLVVNFGRYELECIYNDSSWIEPIIISKVEEIRESRNEVDIKEGEIHDESLNLLS